MFFPRFDETAFLRYVDGKAAEGALTKEINEEVIRIKEHKEMRREYMTLLMELQKYKTEGMQEGIEIGMKQGMKQGMEKGMEKGMKEGEKKKSLEIAKKLLTYNTPLDIIANSTGLSIEEIKKLKS